MPVSNQTPIVSANFGTSSVSVLYFDPTGSFKVFSFPYSYSYSIFKNSVSEADFNLEVIKLACKSFKVSLKDCDLVATAFPNFPVIDTEIKLSTTLDQVLSSITDYNCIYAGYFKVLENSGFTYTFPISEQTNSSENDATNLFGNLSIYPQITFFDDKKKFAIYNMAKMQRSQNRATLDSAKPVLFTGYSLQNFSGKNQYLSYILCIDLIKEVGCFEIKLDEANILTNLAAINMYKAGNTNVLDDRKLVSLGTLLNTPGYTECYVEGDTGTSQLITLEKEKLFFLPLEEGATAKIVVKNAVLGNLEKNIKGGRLGLILDTREKNDPQFTSQDYFEKNSTLWLSNIKEAMDGLYVYTSNKENN